MRPSLYSTLRGAFEKYPSLRPLMRFVNQKTLKLQGSRPVTFAGWGMQTAHALPWEDGAWPAFEEANKLVRDFEFAPGTFEPGDQAFDGLRWRHWTVCWSVEYALRFATRHDAPLTMVECGVAVGITSFFALQQARSRLGKDQFQMHLYDSWSAMRESQLLPDEAWQAGAFSYNSLERTKRNLKEHENNLVYHAGYIPEIFEEPPDHPNEVHYLSIDLDSGNATRDALEYFLPRLARNGIVVIHDFGHSPYAGVRRAATAFLRDKPGLLVHQASGQAVYFAA